MTIIEGFVKPFFFASSGRFLTVEAKLLCFAVVPQKISAAGISGDYPASIKFFEISGRFFMPITKTNVFAL